MDSKPTPSLISLEAEIKSDAGLAYVPCDLCGSRDNLLLFVKEGFRHVRCQGCGLVFVNPRLARHLEFQKQGGTGSMGEEALTAAQLRRLRRELADLEPLRNLNRILEIGAGKGWFLSEASAQGWETWAVEVNRDAAQLLAGRKIDRILEEPAETFQAPGSSVDVVRAWDVIEHLQSPRQAMIKIHDVLRRGGQLRLSTTNFASFSRWVNGPEWVYLNGSDHIFLFEPYTITRLLEQSGFSDIRVRTRSFNLRRKLYHPERDLPPDAPLLRPFRKLIDAGVSLTRFGHQMIVIANKRGNPANISKPSSK